MPTEHNEIDVNKKDANPRTSWVKPSDNMYICLMCDTLVVVNKNKKEKINKCPFCNFSMNKIDML